MRFPGSNLKADEGGVNVIQLRKSSPAKVQGIPRSELKFCEFQFEAPPDGTHLQSVPPTGGRGRCKLRVATVSLWGRLTEVWLLTSAPTAPLTPTNPTPFTPAPSGPDLSC